MGRRKGLWLLRRLIQDEQVDLIYIATPHSHHYEQARQCLLNGKAVLCEKTFTANKAQAEELVALARERKVFLAEASGHATCRSLKK